MTAKSIFPDNVLPMIPQDKADDARFSAAANYINRELSILQFNWRVLQQSLDPHVPILERIKYLAICSSNLDEFFEVRVAGVRHRVVRDDGSTGPDGISPTDLLNHIYEASRLLVDEKYRILNEKLYPALAETGIRFPEREEWSVADCEWVRDYFRKQVAPVITPISLDLTHPFPRLINKSLHFLLRMDGNDAFGRDLNYAILHMPKSLPRLVNLPADNGGGSAHRIILLSEIIEEFAEELFPGMHIKGCHQFRLTRDSDLMLDELGTEDLALALKKELSSRDFGASVRLEVNHDCPGKVANFLLQKCGLTERELFRVRGPVNLYRFMHLNDLIDRSDLKFEGFTPGVPADLAHGNSILNRVAEKDYLLEHPYQAFWPVIDMLREAGRDPDVLAIQQTLYRIGSNSPVIDALIDAAHAGKEVTAIIELRARFDEAENIAMAQRLQDAGALVVYGVVGYKTHAKMLLIVRREKKKLKRYAHLGTGNYHVGNAKMYTDYSLLTSNKHMCEDVHKVFQQLTGMGKVYNFNLLWTAPFTLKKNLITAIRKEVANVAAGGRGHIVAKLNSLTDGTVIEELYRASTAGVKIELLIRGICALRPGVAGVSENIRVCSIVGRFLEHSRLYYFYDNGEEHFYCSSADWMDRNLDRRVEISFPILQEDLKERLKKELLDEYLKDTGQSWHLQENGDYLRERAQGTPQIVQERLLKALGSEEY
ncbi:MAG: polyphosphate kinase 1 [Gammaproteobacteria bacterium]|nr:polyphosphate kinase 1 [Gammaproteobacteria bacterium]